MGAHGIVSKGPRAAEARLLAEISRHAEAARRDPSLLARPVRVVVPSRSLRDHLGRSLVRSAGAVAGVSIHTLYGLALELLELSGGAVPRGEALFPILVRRAARQEPVLRQRFDSLARGYGVVEAVVSDLLDAGFDASHEAPVHELLVERGDAGNRVEVAQAVVRCTARTLESMHRLGVGHRSLVLRWARALVEQNPTAVLPSRAILVHGFADATGTAADLLAVLVAQGDATVLFDAPPEPGAPAQSSASAARFSERLRARLEGLAPVLHGLDSTVNGQEDASTPIAPAEAAIELLAAPGSAAELRAVALRVRSAIDAGTSPESIALVARDPAHYTLPIRIHFARLGIPFSGPGLLGPPGRAARSVAALLALLRAGPDVELDDWLDALGSGFARDSEAPLEELRLAARVLGARSLADLAAQEPPRSPLELPVRVGLRADSSSGEPFAPHAKARTEPLRRLIEAARSTCRGWQELQALPDSTSFRDQLDRSRALLVEALGWIAEPTGLDPDRSCTRREGFEARVLARLAFELPAGLGGSREELYMLLEKQLASASASDEPIGGQGGGVQILGVMEARSRCFDRLFVLGLNRDVFPRPVREDPVLPDSLRQSLCVLLPELPIKRRGYDEERYLFAQLLAASPHVTLSWQVASDEGRERAPSTLVERLRWARPDLVVQAAPALHTPASHEHELERPAWEHAVLAGIHGNGPQQRASLEAALRERQALIEAAPDESAPSCAVAALADAKEAVLREMDRPAAAPAALGPYFGFVGPVRAQADPRRRTPFVTSLERSAACGWRFLLEGLLRLEALPDPGASLPDMDALDVGSVVHDVLERIVEDARPKREETRAFAVPWPNEQRFEALLHAAAAARLAARAIDSPTLTQVLCERSRPLLERARELDWSRGALQVQAAESQGEVVIPAVESSAQASTQRIRFIADRIDPPSGEGRGPLLTDYKTGALLSAALKPETRRRHLLQAVRTGRHLQAVAYACSNAGEEAAGRYLQLQGEDPDTASASVSFADAEFVDAFHASARALLGALQSGSLAPVLTPPARGAASPCSFCSVAEACSRGDAGARQRMLAWERQALRSDADALPTSAEASLRDVVRMRRGELEAAATDPGGAA